MNDKTSPPSARKKRQGPRPKHVPIRTCVVCREQSTKRQLVRIVRKPDGTVEIDPTGRMNGRGAYLCDRPACWLRAAESEVLAKALNASVTEDLRVLFRDRAHLMTTPGAEIPERK